MDKTKYMLATGLFLLSTHLWAAIERTSPNSTDQRLASSGLIAPYGDNPNILHVFAYKTQMGIANGITRIGAATQRGINKLKPHNAAAQQQLETTVQTTEQKLADAKNIILATPIQDTAPVIQQSLTADSDNSFSSALSNQSATKSYAIAD